MHGDSKIDNFMFKKVSWSYHVDGPDDVYNAVIVDWQVKLKEKETQKYNFEPYKCITLFLSQLIFLQGACYDYLSSDLMWTLYGFMKNLPEKNATIDSFLDYSIQYYHQELLRILKELKVR